MRVSDNTARASVEEALRKTRSRMEGLQIKNATQKRLTVPSDDPAANTKILDIRTQTTMHSQYSSNGDIAKNRLIMTDAALGELYDIFVRAKEIALGQSSDASANADSRLGVAQEISALYQQLVSVANRRVGQQYLFSGYKTLTNPYSALGEYKGDSGEIPVEIQKDVFIAMNLPGPHVFEAKLLHPDDKARVIAAQERGQDLSTQQAPLKPTGALNLFQELDALRTGLLTNDTITVRDSLENLDAIINHVIILRSKVSSRVSGIDTAIGQTGKLDLANAELMSQLEDADYAELWSNLAKEETVLRS
jgi:flagellar hook-associated protein 3 FlgL